MTIRIVVTVKDLIRFGNMVKRPIGNQAALIGISKAAKELDIEKLREQWLSKALDMARAVPVIMEPIEGGEDKEVSI